MKNYALCLITSTLTEKLTGKTILENFLRILLIHLSKLFTLAQKANQLEFLSLRTD